MKFIDDWESRVSSIRLTGLVKNAHSGGNVRKIHVRSIPLFVDRNVQRIKGGLNGTDWLVKPTHKRWPNTTTAARNQPPIDHPTIDGASVASPKVFISQ